MRSVSPLGTWLLCASLSGASPPVLAQERPDCRGESVAVVPLEMVAIDVDQARAVEEAIRRTVASLTGVCVQSREVTVERLGLQAVPQVCDDATCRRSLSAQLDSDWVLAGSVLGVGGTPRASVLLWRREGSHVEHEQLIAESGEVAAGPLVALFARGRREPVTTPELTTTSTVPRKMPARLRRRPALWTLAGLAVAATAAGIAFGAASANTAAQLSSGRTDCGGTGEVYQQCFAKRDALGRQQATVATSLYLMGGVFAVGAVLSWPVDLP
jgi:hypothetical protein